MPRKKPDRRSLMMKIRVRPLVRMPKSELIRQVRKAIRTRMVPDTIEISYMDWEKGDGAELNSGRLEGRQLDDLRAFYNAFTESDIRAERVD
ncbi:MAG: hypothetical protein GY906_22925 [bacterium]|nr:hypothetical protein [bacterium]